MQKKGRDYTEEVNLNWSKKFRSFITFSGRANSKEGIGVIGFESEWKQKKFKLMHCRCLCRKYFDYGYCVCYFSSDMAIYILLRTCI